MKWSKEGGNSQAVLISQKDAFVLVWKGSHALSSWLWVLSGN